MGPVDVNGGVHTARKQQHQKEKHLNLRACHFPRPVWIGPKVVWTLIRDFVLRGSLMLAFQPKSNMCTGHFPLFLIPRSLQQTRTNAAAWIQVFCVWRVFCINCVHVNGAIR